MKRWTTRGPKPVVDGILSGGAANLPALSEAFDEAEHHVHFRRLGGTSAGFLKIAMSAFGVKKQRQIQIQDHLLTKRRLIDGPNPLALRDGGLCWWDVVGRTCREEIGDKTLGQSPIPIFGVVCDHYQRRPRIISSWEHPEVLVSELAGATSAMVPMARRQMIQALSGKQRRYYDGGWAINFAYDAFDDDPEVPTIGIRLVDAPTPSGEPREIVPRGLVEDAAAFAQTVLWSSNNAHLSDKNCSRTLDIPIASSGFDFSLTPTGLTERREAGRFAAAHFDWGADYRCLV